MSGLQTDNRSSFANNLCDQCKQSLAPLATMHVKRQCEKCGKNIYVFELGDSGQGMMVRKGDQMIIPKGSIRLSLDPDRATGKFFRPGITWFVKTLYLEGFPKSSKELNTLLDQYDAQSSTILENSSLLNGLDLNKESDADKAFELVKDKEDSPEWWAMLMGAFSLQVRKAIDERDAETAAWAMGYLVNARAMLIFNQSLEQVVWRGYMIDRLRDVLRLWQANKENPDEEFWQITLSENAFVISQVFSFPVVIMQDKAYLGGKGIANSGGNLLDFLLMNRLTENTALVEIKTPKTKILGSQYRGIYNISSEISGAVLQISNYRDSLIKNYNSLLSKSAQSFDAFNPTCLIIAGNLGEEVTDSTQRKSFELFRNGLKDVQVITYDELFAKIEVLIDLLQGNMR